MALFHSAVIGIVCMVLLVHPVVSQNSVANSIQVAENTKGMFLFNQTFEVSSATCTIVGIDEFKDPQFNEQLLNLTSPVQTGGGNQYTITATLRESLDYEEVKYIDVWLEVTFECNGGTETKKLETWKIVVTDESDTAPHFTEASYDITIPESTTVDTTIRHSPGTSIVAEDPDSADSIRYSLEIPENDRAIFTGVSSLRKIDGIDRDVYDIVLAKPLDYEVKSKYRFKVVVTDDSSMNYSSQSDVTVTVTDVQDKPPKFSLPVYSGRVDEMATQGTSVTQVNAVDGDGETIQNQITYSIVEGLTDVFGVDNVTGVIFTKRQLDVDGDNAIGFNGLVILTVQAEEMNTSGEVQYGNTTDTSQVQIQIDDANDQPPVFSSLTYSGSIRAEAVTGEIVAIGDGGYISVTDRDQAPSNNHFSLHIERDGRPWSAFEPNVQSQYVQASVLIVLKDPDALKGLDNTHVRFQLVARDLSNNALTRNGNESSSVADIIVFVLPQTSTVPPPEAIVDLPITTSDVIVFVMGFLLLLNIIFTVIICRLMRRGGQGGLGLFRRNSKYYVSERKRNESGGVQRINDLTSKPNQDATQTEPTASSMSANTKPGDTLALTGAGIDRNTVVRNTVSSATNRNRCDVTLLHELEEGRTAITVNTPVDEVNNQSSSRTKTDRCDVTPLPSQGLRGDSQQQTSPHPRPVGQNVSTAANGSSKCDVIPLETSLTTKSKVLSNLLERVQQKLTPGGKGELETCDLRPLHEDSPSLDASMTEATNSNNSSFSEKTKCDVAPLIKAAVKSKPERQTKTVSPSRVNVAFVQDNTETKTPKASDNGKGILQNNEMNPNKHIANPTPRRVTLNPDDKNGQAAPQFFPTLSSSQTQITQTGVPPVALALPFGSNSKPKPKDENSGLETAVTNPVYNEEITSKPNSAMKKTEPSVKNSLAASGSQTQDKLSKTEKNTTGTKNGLQQTTTELPGPSGIQARDYVEAAKSLLNSATMDKKRKENLN